MALSETGTRVVVAVIAIPIGLALVVVGGWAFAALLVLIAVFASHEFFRFAERKSARPLKALGAVIAGFFVVAAAVDPTTGPEGSGFATLIVLSLLVISMVAIWARGVEGEPLLSISTTLVGAIYAGALLSFGIFLRHLPGHDGAWHGTALLFAPVLLTWASDTSAYFVGRAFGKRKLIPRVSPGKTVEGAIGAVAGAMLVGIGYAYVLAAFPTYQIGLLEAAVFGILVSVAAQVGDLVESLLKRDVGVKDSGTLLPGHGGALDRFDSLLFTLPLGYFFFRFIVGAPQPF
jgi:phosphatidate cytidylyltransferase